MAFLKYKNRFRKIILLLIFLLGKLKLSDFFVLKADRMIFFVPKSQINKLWLVEL